jgi:hypothetical protein
MILVIGGKKVTLKDEDVKASLEGGTEIEVSEELVVRTTEEDGTYAANLKKEHEKQGRELALKDLKRLAGVEIEGKDPAKIVEAMKEKHLKDAEIEPAEQLRKITEDRDAFKTKLETTAAEILSLKSEHENFRRSLETDNLILANIPENALLPKSDMALILKNRFEVRKGENGENIMVDRTTGQEIKNDLLSYEKPETVFKKFFDDNSKVYLKAASGGAGGADSSGTGKQNLKGFKEEMEGKGIAVNSQEFVTEMTSRAKAGVLDTTSSEAS